MAETAPIVAEIAAHPDLPQVDIAELERDLVAAEQMAADMPDVADKRRKQEAQIEMTRRLQLKGIRTAEDVAAAMTRAGMPVTVRTVYRYKQIIAKRVEHEIRQKHGLNQTVEELAHQLVAVLEETNAELWKIHHAPAKVTCEHCKKLTNSGAGTAVKLGALREIKDIALKTVAAMQSLGLIVSSPTIPEGEVAEVRDKEALEQQFASFIAAEFTAPRGITQPTIPTTPA